MGLPPLTIFEAACLAVRGRHGVRVVRRGV